MTDEERVGLDETRRLCYMLLFKGDRLDRCESAELCGTVANALLHHHADRLSETQLVAVEDWVDGSGRLDDVLNGIIEKLGA